MEFCYKKIFKIRTVSFIFKKINFFFLNVRKNLTNLYNYWKIKEFIWNGKEWVIFYWRIVIFTNLLLTVGNYYYYYYAKWIFLTLNRIDLLDFCCIAKYWNSDPIEVLVGNVRVTNPEIPKILTMSNFLSVFLTISWCDNTIEVNMTINVIVELVENCNESRTASLLINLLV